MLLNRRSLLGIVVGLFVPMKAHAQYDDPVLIKGNVFADAYNKVAEYMKVASPYSIGYKDEVRRLWVKHGVSDKYEKVYKEILSD